MLSIEKLYFTQLGLRRYDQLNQMYNFVKSGGIYNQTNLDKFTKVQSTNLIGISRFEDNELYVHDGHHRIVSLFMSCRRFLYPEEYIITDYNYARYNQPNFKNNWFTPFDPRTHLRIADFFNFRDKVKKIAIDDEQKAIKYIEKNRTLYLVKRKDYNLSWQNFHIPLSLGT